MITEIQIQDDTYRVTFEVLASGLVIIDVQQFFEVDFRGIDIYPSELQTILENDYSEQIEEAKAEYEWSMKHPLIK